jgi:hypothetical protein
MLGRWLLLKPVTLFFSLIFRIPFMRPNDENWPPQKIGAYADATGVPSPAAPLCRYRMRSSHKRFDKTIHVRRIGFVTLRSTPLFVLRRIVLALLRFGFLVTVSLGGLRLLLHPLSLVDLGVGAALQKESALLSGIHGYLLRGIDAPRANDAMMSVSNLIGRLLNIKESDDLIPIILHLAEAYGLILLWVVAVAVMVGLAVNAAMWLALAAWTLVPVAVEDRWLDAMRRQERQHQADLSALTGDEPEAKPVGPTAPHDDDEDERPAGRSRRLPHVAFAGVAVVMVAAVGAVAYFGVSAFAPAVGGGAAVPVAVSLADMLRQTVPEGFRDPSHWLRDGRAGCLIYNPSVKPGESVTWSGGCAAGFAQGSGVAVWSQNGKEAQRDEVTLDHGLRDGLAILRFPNGTVSRRRYDHGRRIERSSP